jgi:phosphinothricin acetyltransferase
VRSRRAVLHCGQDGDGRISGALFGAPAGVVSGSHGTGCRVQFCVFCGHRFTVENTIHVREDKWGSGVGRSLMRALVDKARNSGKHTMIAAIDGTNEVSIRFHEPLGFVEVARMPETGAKFGRWCDLVLLQLSLDERRAPWDS